MAVRVTDIPAIILERIEVAHPAPALFSAAEIDDWPDGSLDHLRECGILQTAQRAEAIVCPGCSWQCHKPVVEGGGRAGTPSLSATKNQITAGNPLPCEVSINTAQHLTSCLASLPAS